MKRAILPFVVAIVVGASIASGFTIMSAKSAPPVVVDSTKLAGADTSHVRIIDSTGAVEKPAALAISNLPPTDSVAKPTETAAEKASATRAGASPIGAVKPGVTQAGAPLAAAKPSTPTTPAEIAPAERRISRVVAAMAPRDAAKILAQLADHDVAIILSGLTEKQEAAVLAQLPPDRLAAITKLVLHAPAVVK